jgi:hypothetical protein
VCNFAILIGMVSSLDANVASSGNREVPAVYADMAATFSDIEFVYQVAHFISYLWSPKLLLSSTGIASYCNEIFLY